MSPGVDVSSMTVTRTSRLRFWLLLWILCAVLSAFTVFTRFNSTVDLAYFLPAAETAQERVLLDRLGQGAGSQLWFIVLPEGFSAEPLDASNEFKMQLENSGLFRSVYNGRQTLSVEALPDVIFANRYLLDDVDLSQSGLNAAISARIPDLTFALDPALEEVIAADPYLSSLEVLRNISADQSSATMTWVTPGGRVYLVAEALAPAYEIGEQQQIADLITAIANDQFGVVAETYGVGAYGVQLQRTIQSEAQFRSVLATLAIILVLLAVYRSLHVVLLSALPLGIGALAALAAVTLLFDQVHGITLAFGFTLFGVAIDFPLHVFSHGRRGRETLQGIWPTLRLGAGSTVLAYLAIAASGSEGLAQLGVFSAVGVSIALLVSMTLLPALLRDVNPSSDESVASPEPARLRHHIWLLVLLLGGAVLFRGADHLWSDDLSALTPLPAKTIERDRALRAEFGAPDIRYLVLLQSKDRDYLLKETLRVTEFLRRHPELLGSVQSVSDLLPPAVVQEQRIAMAAVFEPDFAIQAAREFGLVDDAFVAFSANVMELQRRPLLVPESYAGTVFEQSIASGLYEREGVWSSVLIPGQIADVAVLSEQLSDYAVEAVVIDLKQASVSLVQQYRARILMMLAIAFALICGVLLAALRPGRRLFWVAGGLLATVAGTLAVNLLLFGAISLFNLMAVVLVAGLGLDYLLFLSRGVLVSDNSIADSRHAILASMLSTAAGFAVLASSAVPILSGLGFTVLTGVLIAFGVARLGSLN